MHYLNPLQAFVQSCVDQQIDLTAYDLVTLHRPHAPTSLLTHLFNQTKTDPAWIAKTLSELLSIPLLDLDTLEKTQIPFTMIPTLLIRQYPIMPLWKSKLCLYIGLSDPFHSKVIEAIRFHLKMCVKIILVEQNKLESLRKELLKNFHIGSPTLAQESTTQSIRHVQNPVEAIKDPPLVHYVNQLLYHAVSQQASDIHFEPRNDGLTIRFRIDGLLYSQAAPPKSFSNRILARIKIMAQLDIAERRLAQEGRFTFSLPYPSKIIDCRVSTCPTLYGEKIALRLLSNEQQSLDLQKLGFNAVQYSLFLKALQKTQGMILVTGPTGSGKSRTLYSALHYLNQETVNISSVEDPVEIQLPGMNQVNIHPNIGLDFESVFKTLLRQDPDIMMVGEMRDPSTAKIGMQAAQTGHLVLSTLHTNSAAETLTRLINMEIPAYNIADSVNLIIAQRLARRLCPRCKQAYQVTPQELLQYDIVIQHTMTVFTPSHCQYCTNGYQGRVGIFELLPITEAISQKILHNASAHEIEKQAQAEGMMTLKQAYFEKIQAGVINIGELKRLV